MHILPFIEQDELYKKFKLDEPWDSKHNKELIKEMPTIYKVPGGLKVDDGKTCYLVPVGDDTAFPKGEAGSNKGIRFGGDQRRHVEHGHGGGSRPGESRHLDEAGRLGVRRG